MTKYQPDPKFLTLGDGFADPVSAADFPKTVLRYRNDRAARSVGLDHLSDDDWVRHFGRFEALPDNLPEPLAQRYHGHQFRHYNPDIGDGRGFLFAQMRDDRGRLMDLGTKGSGTTPYSRSGDGRLTLKGGVREILATEMLEAIGVNTSKTFSLIETGEALMRGDEPSPTRSSVMVRLTHGHIRIGTFQRHAYFGDTEKLEKLTDYVLSTYFNTVPAGTAADRACALLDKVADTTAQNAADLLSAGFVHGVLNSDNINVTGEIFDFGPWRFLTNMDLRHVAAYFDETGLYAYGRQAEAIHWDLFQLGGALVDIAGEEPLRDVLSDWLDRFRAAEQRAMLCRLGIRSRGAGADADLTASVNRFLVDHDFPFERFYFDWYGGGASEARALSGPEGDRYRASDALLATLRPYAPTAENAADHPYFAGEPCTMAIDEVERIWAAIAERDDWSALNAKLEDIAQMRAALSAG